MGWPWRSSVPFTHPTKIAELKPGRYAVRLGGKAVAEVTGDELAGGVNLADQISGAQLAPLNVAAASTGAQIGVVNVASEETGAQIGVANVAKRSRGFKLGVVNVAGEHDGDTFGLVNVIGNGIHDVAVYATETMLSNVELQLGSRHIYTSYSFSYQPGDGVTTDANQIQQFHRGTRRIGYGLGIGYRKPLVAGPLRFLAIEAHGISVASDFSRYDNTPLLASARVIAGFHILPGISAIAGLSDNVAIGLDGKDLDIGPGFLQSVSRSGGTTIRHYPGLLLGLQI
jgi:hypothetical protein